MVHGFKAKHLPDGGRVAPRSDPGQNEKTRASFIVDCHSLGEDLSCSTTSQWLLNI